MELIMLEEKDFKIVCSENERKEVGQMTKAEKQEYFAMYSLYRKLFTEYIIEKIDLKKYDDELKKSNLKLLATKKQEMDFYQYFSSETLQYFYLRNNIHLEKLLDTEKAFLKEKIKNEDPTLDEAAKKIIAKSYPKVILEDVMHDEKIYTVAYGPQTPAFMAENNALIIGFRYNEFDLNGMSEKKWADLLDEQRLYLLSTLREARLQMEEKIGMPVVILKYNQYSVIPRNAEMKS